MTLFDLSFDVSASQRKIALMFQKKSPNAFVVHMATYTFSTVNCYQLLVINFLFYAPDGIKFVIFLS